MAAIVGGSAANERLNDNNVKALHFDFSLTAATPTPSAYTVVPPTVNSDAKLVLANGAGAIVTGATFTVTVTGSNPKIGLEIKDTSLTANAELIGAQGFIYSTSGTGNADLGCPVWAGPADLLLASAGVGLALYLHLGQTSVGNTGFDQATGAVKFFITVFYLDR